VPCREPLHFGELLRLVLEHLDEFAPDGSFSSPRVGDPGERRKEAPEASTRSTLTPRFREKSAGLPALHSGGASRCRRRRSSADRRSRGGSGRPRRPNRPRRIAEQHFSIPFAGALLAASPRNKSGMSSRSAPQSSCTSGRGSRRLARVRHLRMELHSVEFCALVGHCRDRSGSCSRSLEAGRSAVTLSPWLIHNVEQRASPVYAVLDAVEELRMGPGRGPRIAESRTREFSTWPPS